MGRIHQWFLVSIVLVSAGSLNAQPAVPVAKPNVLVIFSYELEHGWEKAIGEGIVQHLAGTAELFFEHLDDRRVGNAVYYSGLATHIRNKYASTPLAAVLTCNDAAFKFTKDHLRPIVPDVPIVFCGVNFLELYDLSRLTNFTGIVEKPSYDQFVEMLNTVHREADRIHIFYFDEPEQAPFRTLKTILSESFEVIEHSPETEKEFLDGLLLIDKRDIVITANVPHSLRQPFVEGEEDLLQSAAPVYASWIGTHEWDWHVKRGLIGASVVSGQRHGIEAAKVASRVLEGVPPEDIPIVDQSPNILAFNHPKLRQFDIDEAMLPADSLVMFREVPFHARYGVELTIGATLVLLETIFLLLLLENIRRRKHADRTVERERGFIVQLLDTIPNPVFYKGTNGRYMGCNQAFAEAVGLPRSEIVGKTLKEVSTMKEADYYQKMDRELFQNPGLQILNTRFEGAGDDHRDVLINKATFLDEEGAVRGLIGIIQDITDLKLAERDLQAAKDELETRVEERTRDLASANRELEAFTYTASHDLRSPLRHMNAFSDILLDDYGDRLDDDGRDFLRRIKSASQEMNSLLEALLKLSRIHRAELTFMDVDISGIANRLVDQMKPATPANVDITVEPGMTAWGDPNLIQLLLQNLIENALKYSRDTPSPKVEICSERDENGQIWFRVKDNGAGFDMEFVDKLFTPFQRLHSKAEFPGTGVGLASAARIVARHGGLIAAKGETGKGASFRFTLAANPSHK